MKAYYKPSEETIAKIFACKNIAEKKGLVLEQMDKMVYKSGRGFESIRNKVINTNSNTVIDKAFIDLVLVGEGMRVI